MRTRRIIWALAVFAFSGVLYARGQAQQAQQKQPQPPAPITEKDLIKEIKSAAPEAVIKDVKERGVDFETTPEIEKKLRKAKATDEVIAAARQEGPKVRSQMAKMNMGGQQGTQNVPREQAEAFGAIRGESNPDKAILLVDDFAKKYPDSPLLSYVYTFAATGYQQKGDVEKSVEYADKGLKLKPDNLMCLLLKVGMTPQPQYLNKHDADRDRILQETQTEAEHALSLISKLPKQPNETDADHQKRIAELAASVHSSLGMVHLDLAAGSLVGPDKSELAKAEQEYKAAVATEHPDGRDFYRSGEIYMMEGKLDDALQAFTKAGELGQGTMIKTYADQKIEEIKKAKTQGPAAPKPQ